MVQRLPIENVIGGRSPEARDALGNMFGWGICALGLLILVDAFLAYRNRGKFLLYLGRTLAPYLATLGLAVAVCGFGLAKRYAFGLWLAGVLVMGLVGLVIVDLFAADDYSWLPRTLFVVFIAIVVFGYFLWIRGEFKRTE